MTKVRISKEELQRVAQLAFFSSTYIQIFKGVPDFIEVEGEIVKEHITTKDAFRRWYIAHPTEAGTLEGYKGYEEKCEHGIPYSEHCGICCIATGGVPMISHSAIRIPQSPIIEELPPYDSEMKGLIPFMYEKLQEVIRAINQLRK